MPARLSYRLLAEEAYHASLASGCPPEVAQQVIPAWPDVPATMQRAWMDAVKRVCTLVDETTPPHNEQYARE